MSGGRSLRLVHASDLHLEEPIHGLAEVPPHLHELFLDAPYRAAEAVFDLAVRESVDCLLLAGDVLDAAWSAPRGPLFLREQFERLARHQIAVYWAGGSVDSPENWPHELRLPPQVHRFGSELQEFLLRRGEHVIGRIVGRSRRAGRTLAPHEFPADRNPLPTVAVAYGSADASALQGRNIAYWALGGSHHPRTIAAGRCVAQMCGSPQARRPDETGIHGCSLVEIDADGYVHVQQIATDCVRFVAETLELPLPDGIVPLDGNSLPAAWQSALEDRLLELMDAHDGIHLLLDWTFRLPQAVPYSAYEGLESRLLEYLRTAFGSGEPAAWTTQVRCVSAATHNEPSLPPFLHDFIRTLRSWESADEPLDLRRYLEGDARRALDTLARLRDPLDRQRAVAEAIRLGRALLESSPDPSPPAGDAG
jgi:exonuclease SbcD